ncbi:MAG: hypothetical protein ACXW18_00825 [Pyrinomonadaceae bacterium]
MKYAITYLTGICLILMFMIAPANAGFPLNDRAGSYSQDLNQPSREEVINEVARQTGLTNDAVSLIAKENPQLLQGLNDTVLAVKVVNSLADARDTEALADLMGYAVDKLRDKALPSAMNGFIVAFKVYKTVLEITRDYYYVTKLDAGLYDAYRQARADGLRRGDTSAEEMSTAFTRASTRDWSGYYAVKESMFDALVKAKGYNKALMGETMKESLWRQIDDFWMKRCEAKLLQEVLQANKAELERQIWSRASRQLNAIQSAASRKSDPSNRAGVEIVPPSTDRRRSEPGPSPSGGGEEQFVAEYRSLLPLVLEKNKKPWHTRINIIANAVRQGNGYHVNYQAFCLIEQGVDKGKDYMCSEFETVLDLGSIKSAVADMKRQLGR